MKTAGQVADERIAENYDEHSLQEMLDAGHVDADAIRSMIVAAVMSDRLQHQEYASRDVVVRSNDEIFGLAFEAEVWDIDQMVEDRADDYERDVVDSRHRTLSQYGWDAAADKVRDWWHDETGGHL